MLVSLPGACPSLPVWPFASLQISPAQNAELQWLFGASASLSQSPSWLSRYKLDHSPCAYIDHNGPIYNHT